MPSCTNTQLSCTHPHPLHRTLQRAPPLQKKHKINVSNELAESPVLSKGLFSQGHTDIEAVCSADSEFCWSCMCFSTALGLFSTDSVPSNNCTFLLMSQSSQGQMLKGLTVKMKVLFPKSYSNCERTILLHGMRRWKPPMVEFTLRQAPGLRSGLRYEHSHPAAAFR